MATYVTYASSVTGTVYSNIAGAIGAPDFKMANPKNQGDNITASFVMPNLPAGSTISSVSLGLNFNPYGSGRATYEAKLSGTTISTVVIDGSVTYDYNNPVSWTINKSSWVVSDLSNLTVTYTKTDSLFYAHDIDAMFISIEAILPVSGNFLGNEAWNGATSIAVGGTAWEGQSFSAPWSFNKVEAAIPTYTTSTSTVKIALFTGQSASGTLVQSVTIPNQPDNGWAALNLTTPQPVGNYHIRVYNMSGSIGIWTQNTDVYTSGTAVGGTSATSYLTRTGDRAFRVWKYNPGPSYQRWNGTAWVSSTVKRFDGSSWVLASSTKY